MKHEEYFRYMNTLTREIEKILDIMDKSSTDDVEKLTRDIIFVANMYRDRNNLDLFEEAI